MVKDDAIILDNWSWCGGIVGPGPDPVGSPTSSTVESPLLCPALPRSTPLASVVQPKAHNAPLGSEAGRPHLPPQPVWAPAAGPTVPATRHPGNQLIFPVCWGRV